MSEQQRESRVLPVLMELMSSTANGAQLNGERSGFFQMFSEDPDVSVEPEIHEYRLGVDAAREFIGDRMNDGFTGIAGFGCLVQESGQWMVRGEVFETGFNVSASGCLPLKRTLFGKFKPTSDLIELDGFPGIPGAFTAKADAGRENHGDGGN
jgi:hypothetical protein